MSCSVLLRRLSLLVDGCVSLGVERSVFVRSVSDRISLC